MTWLETPQPLLRLHFWHLPGLPLFDIVMQYGKSGVESEYNMQIPNEIYAVISNYLTAEILYKFLLL